MSSGVQEFRKKEQNGSALSEAMPQALRLARYDAKFFTNPILFSPHSRSRKTPEGLLNRACCINAETIPGKAFKHFLTKQMLSFWHREARNHYIFEDAPAEFA